MSSENTACVFDFDISQDFGQSAESQASLTNVLYSGSVNDYESFLSCKSTNPCSARLSPVTGKGKPGKEGCTVSVSYGISVGASVIIPNEAAFLCDGI